MASPFDDRARTWDDEIKTARAASVADTIAAATSPTTTSRLLEYGAGTGLVSQFLAPRVAAVTLADSSAGMRAVAAEKIADGVLPAGTRIWDLDLATVDAPEESFDLIVTVLTLHHVRDLPTVLARLGAMVAPGGRLAIVDLEADGGAFHADVLVHHAHGHDGDEDHIPQGFDEDRLDAALADSGLRAVYHHDIYQLEKEGRPFPLFLAVCTRPE